MNDHKILSAFAYCDVYSKVHVYRVPRNFDGWIRKLMGKHFAKDMLKSTNKKKDTLNMNIAIHIAEKRTTERLSQIRDSKKNNHPCRG